MAAMSLAHSRFIRISRDEVLLEAQSWLLSGRHLGIGLGDRFGVSQGASGLFEGGVRLANKMAQ
jgi:hypothetical protein